MCSLARGATTDPNPRRILRHASLLRLHTSPPRARSYLNRKEFLYLGRKRRNKPDSGRLKVSCTIRLRANAAAIRVAYTAVSVAHFLRLRAYFAGTGFPARYVDHEKLASGRPSSNQVRFRMKRTRQTAVEILSVILLRNQRYGARRRTPYPANSTLKKYCLYVAQLK